MNHHDERTVTVRVPLTIRRRGGRKLVLAPDGTPTSVAPVTRHIDNAMVKALARAFRWRHLLESGTYGTIDEIAKAEKINPSYVSRVLRMTLLAPDIVEAILGGRQGETVTLARLMKVVPLVWKEQVYRKELQDGVAETSSPFRRHPQNRQCVNHNIR